jgi:hypothetical protein
MPDPATDDEFRQEAERLAQLPRDEQDAILAWQRDLAANPKLRKADRDLARQRADALERLRKRRKKPSHNP